MEKNDIVSMDNLVPIVSKSIYSVTFQDCTIVLVSNYPYSYGSNSVQSDYLPSRKTALRLGYCIALNS